jgi:two-component system cell cycle sensor histidine kinase/response regulator CckA
MKNYAELTREQLLKELSELGKKIEDCEEKLKASQAQNERYRNFLDDPIMIGCLETDLNGNPTYVNRRAHEARGFTREEYLQTDPKLFYPSPEDYEYVRSLFITIRETGKPETYVVKVKNRDGDVRLVKSVVSLIRDESGEAVGFRSVSRDITERRKMIENLRRYKDFVESVEDICFELDLKGNLTFINETATRMLGYSSKDFLLGVNYREYSAGPEQSRKIAKVFKDVFRTGQTRTAEYDVLDANKEIKYLHMSIALIRDSDGSPRGFRGISQDISERKKIEREQERYRNFLENIEDGCYEINPAGYNTFCNQATTRITGYSQKELASINYKIYTKPDQVTKTRDIFAEIYRTGKPLQYSDKIIRKDGEERTIMASASLIRDAEGKPLGFRGIFQDVTERKKLEEKERKLTEQLHQAQKMEAIGTLAGGIAHDFNNLLMGIQGYTSLMLLDTSPGHPHFEKLKAVESIVQSGADLSRQLLGYARGGRYEVKALNLNEVIENTASMFGRTKKELEIHRNLLPGLWSVEADQGQIEQVLLNLFVNAWQAMPGGGSLYLSSNNVMLDEEYIKAYDDVKPGPFVKISVTDTGVGMDEQMKARIFEPFFTTKGMGRGTGIGLASVYGIVRGHKGIIAVYSEKGHGASFNIYLPASDKAAEERIARPKAENIKGHETILLAEDEPVIAQVTTEMLKSLGYEVLNASTGEEAAEIYREHRERIDLVIMDMVMPGGGGGPAVDRISEINPEVKVLLSSGYSLNGMIKEVMDRGGIRSFIQKPFVIGELSQKIREILVG